MAEPLHLLLYDGDCGLCDYTVQFVLKIDTDKRFVFAPLQGETAQTFLKDLPPEYRKLKTLVVVENYQRQPRIYVMSKGAFRILWLIGGGWKLVGWLNFLPSWCFDWAYRWVANRRHRLFPKKEVCPLPNPADRQRFLP